MEKRPPRGRVCTDPVMAALAARLQKDCSIGAVTTATLLAKMPELGNLT